jgi:hypothetical protein
MASELFWMSGMFLWCEVALDVFTREVVYLAISGPQASSEEQVRLPKRKPCGIRPSRRVVVDRSRMDVLLVPPSP